MYSTYVRTYVCTYTYNYTIMRLGQAARVVSLSNPLQFAAVHFSGLVREAEKPSTADKFAWRLAVMRR